MELTTVAAIISFVVLFGAWVIVPSLVKKRHDSKIEIEEE